MRGWAATAACMLLAGAVFTTAHASAGSSAADILAAQPKAVIERLMRDKLVILGDPNQNGPGMLNALVVFEQPRKRALRLLSQTGRQGEYRPELKRIETVKQNQDGTAIDEHQMKIMFMQIDYRVRTHYDFEAGRISWKMDPDFDNDLEDIEGYWELYELDAERTLGRFGTRVSVGPAMPIWLQDYATRKNLPQMMERMRRWVDSNGTYRP